MDVTWAAAALLVLATGLAAAGARSAVRPGPDASEEAGTWRGIAGLGLLAAAVALAATGAAVLAAGGDGAEQIGAFAVAAGTVLLPLLVVAGLGRRSRAGG